MKQRDSSSVTPSRRGFLLGATLGTAGVVAGAAAVVAGKPANQLVADAAKTEEPTGYRVTPHIAHYYRTTQI
jgi:hypothetical protein